jgi:hypothetical protein
VCRIACHSEAVHGVYSVVITSGQMVDGTALTPDMDISLAVALHFLKDILGILT